jgi:hypothetical protein
MLTRSPWCWCYACRARRRRRTAITLVLLAIAAAALAGGRSQPPHARPKPHVARTAHAPAIRRAPASSAATALAAAGQDLSWHSFYGIDLPVSASAGPRVSAGGLASRFADSPRGALLAAINIGVRTAAQWGTAIFDPTITRQVTGPYAAALLQAQTDAYDELRAATHVGPAQPAGHGNAAEVAYRFLAYTRADATVEIVTAGPGQDGATVLASTRIQVVWQRGDWRVVAPPGGNWENSATSLSSLTGYTIFPGER